MVWCKLWWAIFLGEFVCYFVRLCLTVGGKVSRAVLFCKFVYWAMLLYVIVWGEFRWIALSVVFVHGGVW